MKHRLLVGLCVALVAAAVPATASTFLAMDQDELVASSAAVVQGRVLDTRSFWNADHAVIVTQARVEVSDLVAGDAPAVVTVETFGGEVGNYRLEASGFPTFRAGEQVLLFLSPAGDAFRVTGYRQGQYVVRDTAKGQVAVPTLEPGVRLFTRDGRLAVRPKTQELQALKQSIRERHDQLIQDLRSVR